MVFLNFLKQIVKMQTRLAWKFRFSQYEKSTDLSNL